MTTKLDIPTEHHTNGFAKALYQQSESVATTAGSVDRVYVPPVLKPEDYIVDLGTFSATDLMKREFTPQRWAVPGLLPQGCVLLAGRPKVGKSWFAYQLALAVASGEPAFGQIPVERGEVLYLALEDRPERLQSRLKTLLKDRPVPEGLSLAVKWPRLDAGGLDDLEFLLTRNPDTRLVIIDTYQRIRPKHLKNADSYENDYRSLAKVVDLASALGVCVLIIHHTRKASARDEFDTVAGSTGLTGVVDATMVLDRIRYSPNSSLYVTGRDIEESETFLMFDSDAMMWRWGAERSEMVWTPSREQIINVLKESDAPLKPKQIAMKLCKGESNIRQLLFHMVRTRQVRSVEHGRYAPTEDEQKG